MVYYPSVIHGGLDKVISLGDGYTVTLKWYQAYPETSTNSIAYYIYYSTEKETVFTDGVKYVSIDDSTEANIIDLTPGQLYYFSVRAVEYDATTSDLSSLPIAYDNLRIVPSSLLRSDISSTDLIIPLLDITGFPTEGVVNIGAELIHYTSTDTGSNNLGVPPAIFTPASFIDQGGGNYYTPAPGNTGDGYLIGLTLEDPLAIEETWDIRCNFVQRDGYGDPIASTAKFISVGSISGAARDGYSNLYTWTADGYNVSNGVFSFSITENTTFVEGDTYIIEIAASSTVDSGRGYLDTVATIHTTDGYDGYVYWDPTVLYFVSGEDQTYDEIFMCESRFEYPNYPYTATDGYHQVTKDLLTSDLSVSDEENVDFPMYDYAGYHRTDPVQLLNGTCVGSYIGGEIGCIDKYGNYNILRGFSVQDHNNQRQEVNLSVTGRPAVLIKRVRTGVTCSCYLESSEYPDDRCPLCFVPGTLINTINGFVPIEDVSVGDFVLSSDGEYHKVVNTFSHYIDENIYGMETTSTTRPIFATKEHPFLSFFGTHKNPNGCGPNSNCTEYIKRGDGRRSTNDIRQLSSGRWHARVKVKDHQRKVIGTFDTKIEAQEAVHNYVSEHFVPGHTVNWKDIKDLSKGDWVATKSFRHIQNIDSIDIPKEYIRKCKPIKFIVDNDFLWMLGLYIAEGSRSKRSINFSLHKSERNLAKKVLSIFKKYNVNGKIRSSSKNGIVVEVYNSAIARWFPNFVGTKCYNKKIPQILMNLPDEKALSLIRGIFDGGAVKRDNELIQTSEILALQVSEVLQRNGKQPLIRKIVNNNRTPNGNKRKIAYGVSFEKESLNRNNRKGRWQLNEHLLSKVNNIVTKRYSGLVYNLEVEDTHNYVVQNVVARNCHGSKFVIGYEQYFNPRRSDGRIMVRPGPADEDVKMTEVGLESEFMVEFWTLTVPTIKDRDILVLYDLNGNEEFRYEVLSVTRNNTLIGQQGGQKIKAQRIRKYDPAYQIRIFSDTSQFPSKLNTTIGMASGIVPHTHEIVVNEGIISVSQLNQTTAISQGHNHQIVDGIVSTVLGHTHTIILL